jgi:Holliday junction resolvasome RuvABC endonuclease subunit
MSRALPDGLVLGVHPVSQGFGWIAYSNPLAPYDWRVKRTRSANKNAECIAYLTKLIDRLHPTTLVLEAFEFESSERSHRVAMLGRALVALATDRGIEVAVFRKGDVQACFAKVGATTRDDIAHAVARHTPQLQDRLPARRRPWSSEDLRMALFSAAALVTTHYALDANTLLRGLMSE